MHDVDWELLFRYLGKECSAEEHARVERWLAADASHRTILESARTAAARSLASMPPVAARPRVLPRVLVSHAVPRRNNAWTFAAAASVVAVIVGTLLARTPERPSDAGTAASLLTTSTARGARDTIRLHDGTLVTLGATSTLRYPAAFTGASREVYLTGEAYFDVVHDAQHPFRVHAGTATAEDIGTAFGVRTDTRDSSVQVVVADGAVALGGAVLTKGQLGRLATGGAAPTVTRVNVRAYLGWTSGRLVFDETPLAEVAAQLERWYGTEFRIADSAIAARQLTASLTNRPLADVLTVLAQTLDLRIERQDDAIVLHPRRHGTTP